MRFFSKQIRQDQAGQTLVDLIVSMALLSLAVASTGAVATTANKVTTESGQKSQATALATREIEAFRTYRDTHALANEDWATYMPPAGTAADGAGCTQFYMRRTGTRWTAIPAASPIVYDSANSGEPGDETFDNTYKTFDRIMKLCPTGEDKVMSVDATISWQVGTGPHRTVTLRTLIAAWKQETE